MQPGPSAEVVMAGPLLDTKLHVPRRRRGWTARTRLTERLARGDESALTLVSAPAGFGKTTLLTEWLAAAPGDGRLVAWLSLDERDNDPVLFWSYVVAALQTAVPGVGAAALALLHSPQPSTEAVLATLLNDLVTVPDDVVLVLDDFHVIEARDVHDGMAFLLEHRPPRLRVVMAGRADPALPLARMRARGELVELRAADLRFTSGEAAEYLDRAMGLPLTTGDVAALEERTEGWIAALQLAALSLQGRDDPAAFIAGFAGDDRYVVDYLVEEVLQRQPEDVRAFLLQTSVLSRLTGPLCDAVTRQEGSRALLETLDRANLFLVPLDDQRRWYRYHHLFGDVLRARVLDEQPGRVPELHRRASDWYEQNGQRSEAIEHALAAGDSCRAADLVELAIPALRQGRQDATLRRWFEALPEELFATRPVLSAGYVGALMVWGALEGVEARLQDAERWLDTATGAAVNAPAPSAQPVVVDEDEFRRLPGALAVYRAGQARILGDVAGTVTHARRALDLVGDDDPFRRGGAAALLGLAYWTTGDLQAAHRWYAEGMASLERAGYVADVVGGTITLADILIAQGRLRAAMSTYERGLERARGAPHVLRGVADVHVGLSELFRERNDLDAAAAHLGTSRELGEHAGTPQNRYRWRVGMARVRQAEGDLAGALELLDQAERVHMSDFAPYVRPVPAIRARLWTAQGDWGSALSWARARSLSVDDELSYLREYEHVTLARVLLARHAEEGTAAGLAEATRFLERLRRAAEEGERTGSVIEILVLQALAGTARGDRRAALGALDRALALAEPEGYVRLFVDEGPPLAALLRAVATQGTAPGYARRLLAALDGTVGRPPADQGVIEPLSERELEVLRLLGTDLDGPAIARELVVSLNTVRTHTNHIYAKLGVNNRRAAVRRAGELHLLSLSGRAARAGSRPPR
jgi:LuxR family maltose regulon positive regulatory protein